MKDDDRLKARTDLLSIADKLHGADIADGSVLYCTENYLFIAMCDKMSILSDEIRNLLFCLRNLLMYKNS